MGVTGEKRFGIYLGLLISAGIAGFLILSLPFFHTTEKNNGFTSRYQPVKRLSRSPVNAGKDEALEMGREMNGGKYTGGTGPYSRNLFRQQDFWTDWLKANDHHKENLLINLLSNSSGRNFFASLLVCGEAWPADAKYMLWQNKMALLLAKRHSEEEYDMLKHFYELADRNLSVQEEKTDAVSARCMHIINNCIVFFAPYHQKKVWLWYNGPAFIFNKGRHGEDIELKANPDINTLPEGVSVIKVDILDNTEEKANIKYQIYEKKKAKTYLVDLCNWHGLWAVVEVSEDNKQ